MNRRRFAKSLLQSSLAASALAPSLSFAEPFADAPANVRFELSVMLWTVYRDLPFEQRLEKMVEAGYKNIELVGEYSSWSDADFTRVNAKRKALGITFDATAGLKHSLTDPAQREAFVSELRQALVTMERIDCPRMIVLSGNRVPGMTQEAQHQSCIDCLKAAVTAIDGRKINGQPVRLLLETIDLEENPKMYLTSVTEAFDIVETINHPQLQLLYDFYHEQIASGNLIAKLKKNIHRVALVHIADVPGRHAPGTGEIDYGNIFKTLADLKYEGTVAMEFMPTGDPIAELRAARELAIRMGRS